MFYLATKNESKYREIIHILNKYKQEYPDFRLDLKKIDKDIPEDIENFNTYYENALKKAQYVYHQVFRPVIAEDSGLEIECLLGFPGTKTSKIFPGLNQHQKNIAISQMASTLDKSYTKCRYVCTVVILFDFSRYFSFEGIVEGYLAEKPMGENGFGFDPIFYYPDLGMTFAQMDMSLKCSISHRYIAFRKLFDFLRKSEY
ncbi:MAG: non-canonical purine NTP pyrophosphatase [bacterium]